MLALAHSETSRMLRYRLLLEYDGGPFRGWQRQEEDPSVQVAIEEAVKAFCGERVIVEGSGRTDTGVHALGQVAHFDLTKPRAARQIRMGLNHHLVRNVNGNVIVRDCEKAEADFHARFSATKRCYLYRILNRFSPPALDRNRVWWVPQELDLKAMKIAARTLEGTHDFTSFRASGCQADSPVRTLDAFSIEREGETFLVRARSRSFLYRQVRNMVGSLVEVGRGKEGTDFLEKALFAKDRMAAGPAAPARGLYLEAVSYDPSGDISS